MDQTPEIQELIERYLNGELSGQALQDFEVRLQNDNALAQEVAFQREMHLFLQESPENELRKNLQQLGEQFTEAPKEEEKKWWYWLWPAGMDEKLGEWLFGHPARHLAWLIPLLLIAGWWFLSGRGTTLPERPIVDKDTTNIKKEVLPLETPRKINPVVEQDTLQSTNDFFQEKEKSNNIVKIPTKSKEPEKPKTTPNIQQMEPLTAPPPDMFKEYASIPTPPPFTTPPTIYWYDKERDKKEPPFDPSLYFGASTHLDSLVAINNQSKTFKVSILEQPKALYLPLDNSELAPNGQFQAILYAAATELPATPVLYMKDNQGNKYGPFYLTDSLKTYGENTFFINTTLQTWDTTPRLAYYSIEDLETGKIFYTEKLPIIPKDSLFNASDFPSNGPTQRLADFSIRKFEDEEAIDFYATDPKLEAVMAQNNSHPDFKVHLSPMPPDSFKIVGDDRWRIDRSLPDSMQALRQAFRDSAFQFTATVYTDQNLFATNLEYIISNIGDQIHKSIHLSDQLQKKYGTNAYVFTLQLAHDYPYIAGLYYYTIYVDKQAVYSGKYVVY